MPTRFLFVNKDAASSSLTRSSDKEQSSINSHVQRGRRHRRSGNASSRRKFPAREKKPESSPPPLPPLPPGEHDDEQLQQQQQQQQQQHQEQQHQQQAASSSSSSSQSPSNNSASSASSSSWTNTIALAIHPSYRVITFDNNDNHDNHDNYDNYDNYDHRVHARSGLTSAQSSQYDDKRSARGAAAAAAAAARLKTAQQTADDLIAAATPPADPIPSRGPTPSAALVSRAAFNPYDVSQLANNPVDPFRHSSIPIDQTAHTLIEYYRNVYHPAVWHVETKATRKGDYGFQTSASDVIRSALQSDVDMYALLACMSSRRQHVDKQPGNYETDEYLGKALAATRRFMKTRASKEPKSNEEILMVIFHLYATEGYRNNIEAAKVHMRGARTIIDMLGGLWNLRDPQMRELLIIGDGLLSAMSLEPCMLPCEFDPGSYLDATPLDLRINPVYDLHGLAPSFRQSPSARHIPLPIHQLIEETAEINWVLANSNDGSPEAVKHALRWIQIRSMAVRHKLLGLQLTDLFYHALRCTLVLWIVTSTTLLGKVRLRFVMAPLIRAMLRSATHLQRHQDGYYAWSDHVELRAWILTMGAICCPPGSADQAWFVRELNQSIIAYLIPAAAATAVDPNLDPSSFLTEDSIFHHLERLMASFFYHEPVFGSDLHALAKELAIRVRHSMALAPG